MSKQMKEKRAELFKKSTVRIFLGKFLSGEIEKLEPVSDPKYGYRYPLLESILGDPSLVEDFLNELYEAGIIERELYDKPIYCPSCSSANVSMRYSCPFCQSFDIEKSSLIEHIKCGYIGMEKEFRKGSKLICPGCSESLTKPDIDHRKAGIWCTCNNCEKSFDIPIPTHFCRDCHKSFLFEEAVTTDVYAYRLTEEARREASFDWVFTAPIVKFLESKGMEVHSPGLLKGKSGAEHIFNIVAFKGEITREVNVIDIAITKDDEVSEQPIIAMFAKIYDVTPDKAYLIAVPKMNEKGKKMAVSYNIILVEAKDQTQVLKALEKHIS
jgi:transcription elongation factor Elf1